MEDICYGPKSLNSELSMWREVGSDVVEISHLYINQNLMPTDEGAAKCQRLVS